MKIILEVIKAPATSHLLGQQFEVDESGGTLGRADSNTWVLPDPHRYLSSLHARIDFCDNRYMITDESTNGVFINMQAKAIGKGNRIPLNPGDQLRLSGYLLEVLGGRHQYPTENHDGSSTRELPREIFPTGNALAGLSDEVAAALSRPAPSGSASQLPSDDGATSHHPDFVSLNQFAQQLGVAAEDVTNLQALPAEATAVVHTCLVNLIRLLHARTRVKEHFGMNITGMQEAENNPLKFSRTLEGALPSIFCQQDTDKSAAQWVGDAFNDLADHQVALLEGLQAGFDALVGVLDPQLIETQLRMQYSSPGSRQADAADLWARYQQVYQQLFEDNNAKFNQIVGLSLIQAYDASIAQSKTKRKTASDDE